MRDDVLLEVLYDAAAAVRTALDGLGDWGTNIKTRCSTLLLADGRKVCVRSYPASVEPRALHRSMRSKQVADAHERLQLERDFPKRDRVTRFYGRRLDARTVEESAVARAQVADRDGAVSALHLGMAPGDGGVDDGDVAGRRASDATRCCFLW